MLEHKRITGQIFSVSGFISESECDEYFALAESIGFTDTELLQNQP